MKGLYAMAVPMKSCSDSQKQSYLITLALATGDVHSTSLNYNNLAAAVSVLSSILLHARQAL